MQIEHVLSIHKFNSLTAEVSLVKQVAINQEV